jgi:hypothetical protein
VGQVNLPHPPLRGPGREISPDQPYPEKRQLIPVPVSGSIPEMAGIVPPFGFEIPMNPVIPRKGIPPSRQGLFE